jgi:SsrA-binding protein
LLHRREINRLESRAREKGFTVIPTRLYLKDGRAKVEIALARGKKLYDKRQAIAERDSKRQMDRALKERHR